MAVLSVRDWTGRRHLARLAVIPVPGVLYVLQALLLIIFFMIAAYRAWQMIGGQNTQLLALAAGPLREPGTTGAVPAPPPQPAATPPQQPAAPAAAQPPGRALA